MSRTYNRITLIAFLGHNPEKSYTQRGTPVTNLSVATNSITYTANGERQENTNWHTVVCWGKQAENAVTYLKKGSRIFVDGELVNHRWYDDEGNKRVFEEIKPTLNLEFLDKPENAS
jgi:single-strand DNA-binding protein